MGTSNILGGLLVGLGQGRARQQREQFDREQQDREKLQGLLIGLMDRVPADTRQEITALLMQSMGDKPMPVKKLSEGAMQLMLRTSPAPGPQRRPPTTIGGGGPQLQMRAPAKPPIELPGGGPIAQAAGLPATSGVAGLKPPPTAPRELGMTPAATPAVTHPGFVTPPGPPAGPMERFEIQARQQALGAAEAKRRADLQDFAAKEQIKATFTKRYASSPQGIFDQYTGEVISSSTPKDPNLSFEKQTMADLETQFTEKHQRPPDASERLQLRSKVRELLGGDAMKEYRQAMLEMAKTTKEQQVMMQTFSRADRLRSDYELAIKNDLARAQGYADLTQAMSGGAGDILILYQFIKMMDPNAVREGEIALAERARGALPEWLMGLWDRAIEGTALNPATRTRLAAQAGQLYRGSILPRLTRVNESYTSRSRRVGVNPSDVVRPMDEFSLGVEQGEPRSPASPGLEGAFIPEGR